jgi:hypothetical protein
MSAVTQEGIKDISHAIAREAGLLGRPSIARRVLTGVAAGAVGTSAINLVTYLDMAVRGRPASQTPAEVVEKLEDKAGITLAEEGKQSEPEQNRRQAVGALLGFVTGLGVGALYGLIRPSVRSVPLAVTGAVAGLAAMAGSDVPATALGATDPKTWKPMDWLADLVPHVAYGMATALAFDALADPYD